MEAEISRMVDEFEEGRLPRRELVLRLMGLCAGTLGVSAAAHADREKKATFTATDINHVALSVKDVPRSRDFYRKHLGLEIMSDGGDRSCFLRCGNRDFLALFRGETSGLHHYCYSVPDYDPDGAAERVRGSGLNPRRQSNRVYFDDPDGIGVQVSA